MNPDDIQKIIESSLADSQAIVTGDGSKFEATVISSAFEGLSMVKEHQLVYKLLNEHIASGAIHALTIKAYTPEEWAEQQG
ncbi:MAG TPA: BolA/IbaG family iron-sulfur metabolism protein [Chromatiales bacterium]|nr:BolA/IbaG family iron-sulfur metabolism protein [Thiotrichales bacterium]HIP67222.1 BolA/IbaG family iron-sulfur metabolism protein [Chromatiales bacterium]